MAGMKFSELLVALFFPSFPMESLSSCNHPGQWDAIFSNNNVEIIIPNSIEYFLGMKRKFWEYK